MFFNTIMLRCILKKSQNMSLKIFSNCAFSAKIALNCFYATFQQWLKEVKSPYTYFSLIRLIPNFYDVYIMHSQ